MFRPRLTVFALLMVWALAAAGYTLTEAEREQLHKGRELAAKVYERTGDAAGAAAVMVEAGVKRLVIARPDDMAQAPYLQILEDYAGYLARVDGRAGEAAELLKTIIQADPARHSAYLSLGELYQRRYRATHDAQHRRIYTAAYEKYLEQLRRKDLHRLLPGHIVDAVYPDVDGICELATHLHERDRLAELQQFFNPETNVRRLDPGDKTVRSLADSAVSFAGLVRSAEGAVRVAEVDLDNDGDRERRYSVVQGDCRRNAFYKRFDEQTVLFSNELLDRYYPGGRICGDAALFPVRYSGAQYLVETQPDRFEVYKLHPSGAYEALCRVRSSGELAQNLVSECEAPVCGHLASNIEAIVAAEGRVGAETPVAEGRGPEFAPSLRDEAGIRPYVDSEHHYTADLDNDGEAELIVRLWQERADKSPAYSHRVFEQRDGRWHRWQWPVDIDADHWFFVEPYDGVNYLVAYQALQQSDGVRRYELHVHRLRDGEAAHLGSLKTRRRMPPADTPADAETETP